MHSQNKWRLIWGMNHFNIVYGVQNYDFWRMWDICLTLNFSIKVIPDLDDLLIFPIKWLKNLNVLQLGSSILYTASRNGEVEYGMTRGHF